MLDSTYNYNTLVTPAAETIDKIKMSFLQWLALDEAQKEHSYSTYREYYDGEHDTMLSDRMRQFLQVKDAQEFNVNYCPIVVDAVAERLIVTGFDANEQSETFWKWWNLNRMDAQQRIIHSSAGRDGDSYVLVSWDEETNAPVFTPEIAYDGHEGVKVHYDKDHAGQIECATKRWRVEQGNDAGYVRRLNIYWPDRVEKYISDGRVAEGNWHEYYEEDETGEMSNVKWWTDNGAENGNPLGVPVFHFKANDRGYNYGKSDLHDIIPIQNALNKSMIDLLAAADTTGFRMYVMLGDDPSDLTVAPGMWLYSTRPPSGDSGASIDFMPGEDLAPMINLKDSLVAEIARVSRTPISYFQASGQVAAEGTLKQQESGLIAKVEDRQIGFGNSWEDVMSMARRLNNAFGTGENMSEDEPISTLWADAETRNEEDLINTVGVMVEKLHIPLETAWKKAGLTPDEIVEMMETAEYKAALAGMLQQEFEAGNYPDITRWKRIFELMNYTETEIREKVNQMLEDAAANDGFGFVGPNDEVEQ